MNDPLTLCNVGAGYRRKHPVLDDVNLIVPSGSITGLLGRNGAGKTTLIHTALGLRKVWHGKTQLFGHDAWNAPASVRCRIGYVPQQFVDFHWLTPSRCIDLVASFHADWDHRLVVELRERWSLPDEPIGALSPGMRQCVAVLLAIGHRPDLLVLDEPVAMLDPSARRNLLRAIGDLNAETQQTVLLSSHICSDVERICSNVAILHAGRIALDADIDDLKDRVRPVYGLDPVPIGADVLAHVGSRLWLRNWHRHDLSNAARVGELNLEELFLDMTA
ncbi:MAG: ABC transporter ATP-binding protein [Gammaproteobacteria bacterium]|nr:ABC transporter ATP-binding protein [Gammaproteobacteria bacterium]